MSGYGVYLELGVRHILDPRGLDHVLFIVALACGYEPRQWRSLLLVVTAFTAGHSLTLALVAIGTLSLPSTLIEVLIPVTIAVTGIHGVVRPPVTAGPERWLRPSAAALFGLVHGAGFAAYLRSLFVDSLLIPLAGFNVGLEIGQLMVLGASLAMFAAFDRTLLRAGALQVARAVRVRTVAVSGMVTVIALAWTAERLSW